MQHQNIYGLQVPSKSKAKEMLIKSIIKEIQVTNLPEKGLGWRLRK